MEELEDMLHTGIARPNHLMHEKHDDNWLTDP
jgi:hypothetical protein